jgi:hypothetical protein
MDKIFNVRITSGTSPGPYNVYYDSIDPNNIALLTGTETPATGLTLSELVIGVGVIIPENSTSVILYNIECDNNITHTILTPTPTSTPLVGITPTPTPSSTPTLFTIYRSGFAAVCTEFCQNKFNFTIQTTATNGYNDIGPGDIINGIISSGFYAIGSDPGNTDDDPFKIVQTDSNGVVQSVLFCAGTNECEPF